MKNLVMLICLAAMLCGACRKKKVELENEHIVSQKVLVNESPIHAVNNSDIDKKLIVVEGKMIRITNALENMQPDTTEEDIAKLASKTTRELKGAQKDLRKVISQIERNNIPEAESKLDNLTSELSTLEMEIADSGY